MENENAITPFGECNTDASASCKWVGHSKLNPLFCTSGNGGCFIAKLSEAEESEFHTTELANATKEINEILGSVSANGKCKLSFIDTGQGIMLAWVEHGGKPMENEISRDSDPEVVAKHLKLVTD